MSTSLRLKQAMKAAGFNKATDLARASGVKDVTLRAYLGGTRHPPLDVCELLANPLGVSARWLFDGTPPRETSNGVARIVSASEAEPQLVTIQIVGEVRAGTWHSVNDVFDREDIVIARDPRLDSRGMFALRVRGASINRQAPDGAVAVCLDVYRAPRAPRHGDWVIVRRMRNGTAETTVKQLRITVTGKQELWPDSTDPNFQSPILVDDDDSDDLSITAFVVDFIRPATQF